MEHLFLIGGLFVLIALIGLITVLRELFKGPTSTFKEPPHISDDPEQERKTLLNKW